MVVNATHSKWQWNMWRSSSDDAKQANFIQFEGRMFIVETSREANGRISCTDAITRAFAVPHKSNYIVVYISQRDTHSEIARLTEETLFSDEPSSCGSSIVNPQDRTRPRDLLTQVFTWSTISPLKIFFPLIRYHNLRPFYLFAFRKLLIVGKCVSTQFVYQVIVRRRNTL